MILRPGQALVSNWLGPRPWRPLEEPSDPLAGERRAGDVVTSGAPRPAATGPPRRRRRRGYGRSRSSPASCFGGARPYRRARQPSVRPNPRLRRKAIRSFIRTRPRSRLLSWTGNGPGVRAVQRVVVFGVSRAPRARASTKGRGGSRTIASRQRPPRIHRGEGVAGPADHGLANRVPESSGPRFGRARLGPPRRGCRAWLLPREASPVSARRQNREVRKPVGETP